MPYSQLIACFLISSFSVIPGSGFLCDRSVYYYLSDLWPLSGLEVHRIPSLCEYHRSLVILFFLFSFFQTFFRKLIMHQSVKLTDGIWLLQVVISSLSFMHWVTLVKSPLGFEPWSPAWEEDDLLTELSLLTCFVRQTNRTPVSLHPYTYLFGWFWPCMFDRFPQMHCLMIFWNLHGTCIDTLLACSMWLQPLLAQIMHVQCEQMKSRSQDRQNMPEKSGWQYKYVVAEWCW